MKVLQRLFAFFLIEFYILVTLLLPISALPGTAFAQSTAPHPTCSIAVSTSVINVGGSVTVKWTSTDAVAGAITNIGNVGPSGSINLLPASTGATYFGAFTGPGGTANCQASVSVNTAVGGGAATTQTTDAAGNPVNVGTAIQTGTAAPTAPVNSTVSGSATNGGLVPCGTGPFAATDEESTATGCQACDLPILIQNIINFAIGLSIPIAAALFAWAGVLFFTAADNTSKINQAKQIFRNAFIGFIIAITAWIIINTVLVVIFSNSKVYTSGSWFTIQCSTTVRPVNGNINDVLGILSSSGSINTSGSPSVAGSSGVGSGATTDGSGSSVPGSGLSNSGSDGSCPAGYVYLSDADTCSNADGSNFVDPTLQQNGSQGTCPAGFVYLPDAATCSDSDGNTVNPTLTAGTPTRSASSIAAAVAGTQQYSAQLQQICSQQGFSDCSTAQAVMAMESNGNASVISKPGAVGLMQLMPATARGLDPTDLGGLSDAQVTARLVNDTNLNMTLGVQYLQQLQSQTTSTSDMIAAYNGGLKATNASVTCPGQEQWQCAANPGYQETRNYVPNVLAAKSLVK